MRFVLPAVATLLLATLVAPAGASDVIVTVENSVAAEPEKSPQTAPPEQITTMPEVLVTVENSVAGLASEAPPLRQEESPPACPGRFDNWPVVTAFPRPGYFLIPPTGSGYYSAFDCIHGEERESPPKYPYPRFGFIQFSFFDADWRYLDKPDNKEHDFFDCLKRIPVGDCMLFTTGGDFRWRLMAEDDARLSGTNNTYNLLRTRVYGDLLVGDRLRLYAEFLDARDFDQELGRLPIDANHGEFLNAFVDLRLAQVSDGPLVLRVGRQELLYGSQRLLSPLDWANTRRTFDGVKLFRRGETLDVDFFCVSPVTPDPGTFDSHDNNQVFTGLWATYRPQEGRNLDAYVLNLDNTNNRIDQGLVLAPFNITTIGARCVGKQDGWLWDFEGAVQFGDRDAVEQRAAALTTALGYVWEQAPWTPQAWLSYDYASGDDTAPGSPTSTTFNQLFPFGHYYFGYADIVGRQNIHDVSGQFAVYPTKWLTAYMQYHIFRLANPTDALYNAAGVPLRRDPTGAAGRDVGQELDFLANLHLSTHQDVLVGYSHLFAGDFIRRTGNGRSPDYFYLQYSFRW